MLEGVGIDRQAALAKYSSCLTVGLPTLASSLAFWRAQGSPQPLSLHKLLKRGDAYLMDKLGANSEQWAAFQASALAVHAPRGMHQGAGGVLQCTPPEGCTTWLACGDVCARGAARHARAWFVFFSSVQAAQPPSLPLFH